MRCSRSEAGKRSPGRASPYPSWTVRRLAPRASHPERARCIRPKLRGNGGWTRLASAPRCEPLGIGRALVAEDEVGAALQRPVEPAPDQADVGPPVAPATATRMSSTWPRFAVSHSQASAIPSLAERGARITHGAGHPARPGARRRVTRRRGEAMTERRAPGTGGGLATRSGPARIASAPPGAAGIGRRSPPWRPRPHRCGIARRIGVGPASRGDDTVADRHPRPAAAHLGDGDVAARRGHRGAMVAVPRRAARHGGDVLHGLVRGDVGRLDRSRTGWEAWRGRSSWASRPSAISPCSTASRCSSARWP